MPGARMGDVSRRGQPLYISPSDLYLGFKATESGCNRHRVISANYLDRYLGR